MTGPPSSRSNRDPRTVYCPECGKIAKLVHDVRSERTGWACPDTSCPCGRRFITDEEASRV